MHAPQTFVLRSREIRERAACFVATIPVGEHPMEIVIREHKNDRTLEQNALMWRLLGCIAKQTNWHGIRLQDFQWKDIFTAGMEGELVVPNLAGNGFVVLGKRTSEMKVGEMSDLIDLLFAFCAERNLQIKDKPPCKP